MNCFGVLTNRRLAVIALIHSIVFLGIAIYGFVSPKAGILYGAGAAGDYLLLSIYALVASILLWLASISRNFAERGYFVLCAASASSGIVRTIVGDQLMPPARYARVLLLSSAVWVGFLIVRSHSRFANRRRMTPLPSQVTEE